MTSERARTLLVTGGCGYLGSQLIRDLAADDRFAGRRLRILDNFEGGGRHEAILDLPAGDTYEVVEGDLLNPAALRLALAGVDAVIHLAAVVRTPFSFDRPSWLEQINHWGTAHLVDACIEAGTAELIYAGSAAVYGPGGPFFEADPPRPLGPYAHSKLGGERVVLAAAERGLATTVLRLGSLFGAAPVVRFDAVANRLIYLAGIGRSVTVFGDGRQRRPLIHVRDASGALRRALVEPSWRGRVFNAVAENPSVLEIVEAVQASRPQVRVRFGDQDVLTHLTQEVDARALRAEGWTPGETLAGGVGELLDRFRGLAPSSPPPVPESD